MRYIPLTKNDQEAMLRTIGASTIGDLFSSIPSSIRKKAISGIPPGRSESELAAFFKKLSDKNASASSWSSYLGCGAYDHFIPVAVDALAMRGEFATAYTPYQPEVSQGTLQAIFEFQSLIVNLYEMDISNASMYDGASAAAEAVLMALRLSPHQTVYVSRGIHPEYLRVIRSYVSNMDVNIREMDLDANGQTSVTSATDEAAAVVVAQPNFFGVVEDLSKVSSVAKLRNALCIVVNAEPVAFGLIKPPGHFGADIVVGEGQSFGNPVSYGGPYLGLFATRKKYLRQMPGRLVGQTLDQEGKRGYVLTLSTREQHIRREKATSNICTNHSLCALRAAIYLSLLGKSGLMEVARANFERAQYLKEKLLTIMGIELRYPSSLTFNEFTLKLPMSSNAYLSAMQEHKIFAGVPLTLWDESRTNEVVVSVTETKALEDLDAFVETTRRILR